MRASVTPSSRLDRVVDRRRPGRDRHRTTIPPDEEEVFIGAAPERRGFVWPAPLPSG
jgi:hypothetical protein